jgi:hypothetical protein
LLKAKQMRITLVDGELIVCDKDGGN